MTLLRKTMIEELERRNFSQSTTSTYIRTLEDFAGYFAIDHQTSWVRSTSANIRRNYSPRNTCLPTP